MEKILIGLLLCHFLLIGCKKDCCTSASDTDCDNNALTICDESSLDLKRYVAREDTLAQYGTASAIKSVPQKGEIKWVANNFYQQTADGGIYVSMSNYADTAWVGLEPWAYRRDRIGIYVGSFAVGRHSVFDYESHKIDSTKNYSLYRLWHDDVVAERWAINMEEDNYVIINSIDEVTKVIEGEFYLHFIQEGTLPSGTGLVYSEEVNFRCGRFKARKVE